MSIGTSPGSSRCLKAKGTATGASIALWLIELKSSEDSTLNRPRDCQSMKLPQPESTRTSPQIS